MADVNPVHDSPPNASPVSQTPDAQLYVISGRVSDYHWSLTEDGESIVVWNEQSVDVLRNVQAIRFMDAILRLEPDGILVTDPLLTAHAYTLAESSDGYLVSVNQTGNGLQLWKDDELSHSANASSIAFDDLSIELGADHLTMTSFSNLGNETRIEGSAALLSQIRANASQIYIDSSNVAFGWASSGDTDGLVVWQDQQYLVIHGIEQIVFNDGTVSLVDGDYTLEAPRQHDAGTPAGDSPQDSGSLWDTYYVYDYSSNYSWTTGDSDNVIVLTGYDETTTLVDFDRIEFADRVIHHLGDGRFDVEWVFLNTASNEIDTSTSNADGSISAPANSLLLDDMPDAANSDALQFELFDHDSTVVPAAGDDVTPFADNKEAGNSLLEDMLFAENLSLNLEALPDETGDGATVMVSQRMISIDTQMDHVAVTDLIDSTTQVDYDPPA